MVLRLAMQFWEWSPVRLPVQVRTKRSYTPSEHELGLLLPTHILGAWTFWVFFLSENGHSKGGYNVDITLVTTQTIIKTLPPEHNHS